jgi:hypothetical protein
LLDFQSVGEAERFYDGKRRGQAPRQAERQIGISGKIEAALVSAVYSRRFVLVSVKLNVKR